MFCKLGGPPRAEGASPAVSGPCPPGVRPRAASRAAARPVHVAATPTGSGFMSAKRAGVTSVDWRLFAMAGRRPCSRSTMHRFARRVLRALLRSRLVSPPDAAPGDLSAGPRQLLTQAARMVMRCRPRLRPWSRLAPQSILFVLRSLLFALCGPQRPIGGGARSFCARRVQPG